jgi:hypothetical protein
MAVSIAYEKTVKKVAQDTQPAKQASVLSSVLICLGCISLSTPSRVELSDEVSTGSGSDWVIVRANSTVVWIETRSLPLPVLTA